MTTTAAPAVRLLRLHVDSYGQVWYGKDGVQACRSGCSAETFVDRLAHFELDLGTVRLTRLLGTPANAALILKLRECRADEARVPHIQVGSPALLGAGVDAASPYHALHVLWQPSTVGAVCARWHDLRPADYRSYDLVDRLRDTGGQADPLCLQALRKHPAWLAFSFLPACDQERAVRVITRIVDPRWFRHPLKPHRAGRLLVYLGVTPANAWAFWTHGRGGRHYPHFLDLLYSGCGQEDGVFPPAGNPRSFLTRVLTAAADPVRGLLAALRQLVTFVATVWEAEAGGSSPFEPRTFFKREDERLAWHSHRRTYRAG